MALTGIGNGAGGGSPLDRFQKLRDAAQKKLETTDRQAGLADLIQRKQKQLGAGDASPDTARSQAERIPAGPGFKTAPAAPGLSAGPATGSGAAADAAARARLGDPAGLPAPAAYGRTGAARKQDTAPRLGRYVDFLA
jgi:hypothetical protein